MSLFAVMFLLFGMLFATMVVLLVVAVVHAQRKAAERRSGLAAYAAHREWEYQPEAPSLVTRFQDAPFGRGSSRRAYNALTGRHDGRPFVAFDYSYTTSSGSGDNRSTTTHTYSILALHLGATAPQLAVAPAGGLRKLWEALTGLDHQVGDPAFDEAFVIKSTSAEFVRDVLHPDMRALLMANRHFAWRFEADSMLVFHVGQHNPQQIEGKLQFMDAVLDRIPETVWARLGGAR